jgi:hypothetical protein
MRSQPRRKARNIVDLEAQVPERARGHDVLAVKALDEAAAARVQEESVALSGCVAEFVGDLEPHDVYVESLSCR